MPPCVHHRFSRLPIARIHLSHRSPELISAFASVRPSARLLHDDSYTLPTIPSASPSRSARSTSLPTVLTPSVYPSRDPYPLVEATLAAIAIAAAAVAVAVSAVPSIVDATRLERFVEGRIEREDEPWEDTISSADFFICLLISYAKSRGVG